MDEDPYQVVEADQEVLLRVVVEAGGHLDQAVEEEVAVLLVLEEAAAEVVLLHLSLVEEAEVVVLLLQEVEAVAEVPLLPLYQHTSREEQ